MARGTHSGSGAVFSTLYGYASSAVSAGQYLAEYIAVCPGQFGAIKAYAYTAGTGGGNTVLDILKNGTSIYSASGNKPTLAATSTGQFANAAISTTRFQAGDVIALQVLSISTTGHARLMMTLGLQDSGNGIYKVILSP